MKKIILIISIILVIYIVFINSISYVLGTDLIQDTSQGAQIEEGFEEGSEQNIGTSFSVDITVTHNRLYGKIIESDKNSKLYILSFIPLPLISDGFNLKSIHLIFIILISLLFLFLTIVHYSKKFERRTRYASDNQSYLNSYSRTFH